MLALDIGQCVPDKQVMKNHAKKRKNKLNFNIVILEFSQTRNKQTRIIGCVKKPKNSPILLVEI